VNRVSSPRSAEERDTRRSRRRDLLGLVISAVLLAAVVWWALEQPRPTFPSSPEDLLPLAVAIGLYAVATVIRGWRWHMILLHAGIGHARADAYALTVVGYMGNTVLPARGGEILRILLLGERTDARRREILGSIVAERALDVVALVVLFALLTWSQVAGAPVGQTPAAVSLALIAAAAVVLVFYVWLRRRGRLERFASIVRPFLRASRLMVGRLGLVLLLVTIGVWVLEGAIFWLIGQSLELDVAFLEGLFLVVLTSFFLSVPAAPGYLGTFDAALIFGLKALDIDGGEAVSFVLLARFVLFVPITVAGLVLMLTRYGGFGRMFGRRPAEVED
jgi:glycosyltransferase 2 family protein